MKDSAVMNPVRTIRTGSAGPPRRSKLLALDATEVSEREQPDGVLRQDERADLVAEPRLLEVGEPAVGRDHREVRPEEDLVAQLRVRVLDELRREVLRRPAGEVDPDVVLVQADGDRLVLPWERGVGEHDLQLG